MKALIIANGFPPDKALIEKHADADILIAADGGYEYLLRCGLKPDYLVGDFDSARKEALGGLDGHTQVVRLSEEKNETDSMVAIDIALQDGAFDIVMLGALGKRSDHAQANIMLLKYAFDKGARLLLEDEYCEVFLATGQTRLTGRKGQTVSILPFGGEATVSSDDALHYPMDRLYMAASNPVGVSNVFDQSTAVVDIQGFALIFMIK